ncbi:MAG: hypothetical protein HC882_07985 [Acidobacteria bacterium]|nr:hypothetical protein [Acidobacteriota bacterium]
MFTPHRAAASLLAGAWLPAVAQAQENWAFEETFDSEPRSPSQDLLPRRFDYVATHRTHPSTPDGIDPTTGSYGSFLADHDHACGMPPTQRSIGTTHRSNGAFPDESFFICRNHMMSAMGDVEGYSVSAFWPRQEFDFAEGGVIEFDVNLYDGHPRSWWEILIAPRYQQRFGAAQDWLPISETYPADRIVLTFDENSTRKIQVGRGQAPPAGWITSAADWASWRIRFPDDPAVSDRRMRRRMRIELSRNRIVWKIQQADGAFHPYSVDVPDGLPFTRGLVVIKTHAYTPTKDGNMNLYTYHWDNLRFSGPVLPPYESFEAPGVVNLEGNGSVPIGITRVQRVELAHVGASPVLAGQTHSGLEGQILVSINGNGPLSIVPNGAEGECYFGDWRTFHQPIDPAWLVPGVNLLEWRVGERPACARGQWYWDGFAVKGVEIQFEGLAGAPGEASARDAMRVSGYDAQTDRVSLTYEAACGASQHVVYSGPLQGIAELAWARASCGLGATGTASADVGAGSRFS